ncbi:MAG: hypothetical protein IJL43_06510, partial [Lachnospiraceae bacterium]|nr:hypothetical protein [Lachnospiraceae bacterium]
RSKPSRFFPMICQTDMAGSSLKPVSVSGKTTYLFILYYIKEQKTGQAKSTAAVHLPAFHTFPLQL